MDRALDAVVNFDVPADIVRIEVRGSLHCGSRPHLVHIIRRVRRMGIRCHISVDLSQADLVESSALSGLRSDLNALDANTLSGGYGAGVSLQLTPLARTASMDGQSSGQPLPMDDDIRELFPGGRFAGEYPHLPVMWIEELYGRPLTEYSNEELLAASDALFALLDNPHAQDGADLLGRYNDIGLEIHRRQQEPSSTLPVTEGQAAS
ncbi:hypothetical protein [Pseudarthrobacter sp. BRE9]|jgi:hypothetical protein|uniref:hypothetical protein n=1 Tax=Pseudarthrobacter sp. BRE9 TaxID=2962582 RepID=UPI0028829822|nr:hypothetical protein [Pseudarthrobacter sp. BRE9]MDT0170740.1 hypothetical protein [Pseudarthrobacter sp. BRE9]